MLLPEKGLCWSDGCGRGHYVPGDAPGLPSLRRRQALKRQDTLSLYQIRQWYASMYASLLSSICVN